MVYSDHDALKGSWRKDRRRKDGFPTKMISSFTIEHRGINTSAPRLRIRTGWQWQPSLLNVTPTPTPLIWVGLGLGGGHERLEGLYDVVGDGFVHLNVVLANGSEVGVSHEDLFWAMIGIVASFRVKIYPQPTGTWHYHSYIWTQDKFETVYQELNKFHKRDNGTTLSLMGVETRFIGMDTSISQTEPVLSWAFEYSGPAKDAERLLQPFNLIGTASEVVFDVSYPDIAQFQGAGEHNAICSGGPFVHSSNLLLWYNVTKQRQLYNQFVQKISQYPELRLAARLTHESYANKAVQAIPYDSTAYPYRDQNYIVYFLTAVPPGSDLKEPAETWAKEAWNFWNAGQAPKTYVNYASGQPYETVESVYGYEPWRLDILRSLKAKYDPHNRFRFYEPIVAKSGQ